MGIRRGIGKIAERRHLWVAGLAILLAGCNGPSSSDPEKSLRVDSAPGIPVARVQNRPLEQPDSLNRPAPTRIPAPPPPLLEQPMEDPKSQNEAKPDEAQVKLEMRFVRIEPGEYQRGTTAEQLQRIVTNENWQADEMLLVDETPAKRVTISKPFEILATEVTQQQYREIMGNMPANRSGEKLPVTMVTHPNCLEFCTRLAAKTGWKVRLPTEAEWEYAARAGSESLWAFGDDELTLEEYAWYDWNAESGLMPVGKLRPNRWGLYDMHGNAWEWCADFYQSDYYSSDQLIDPQGPKTGEAHVVRGGYFFSPSWQTRCAERDMGGSIIEPGDIFAKPNLGFRIVREVE